MGNADTKKQGRSGFDWTMAPPGAFALSEMREQAAASIRLAKEIDWAFRAAGILFGFVGSGLIAFEGQRIGMGVQELVWAFGFCLAVGIALGRGMSSAWIGACAWGAGMLWLGIAQVATGGALLSVEGALRWVDPSISYAAKIAIAHAGAFGFAWLVADLHEALGPGREREGHKRMAALSPASNMERAELSRLTGASRRAERYLSEIEALGRAPTRWEFVALRRESLEAMSSGGDARGDKPEPIRPTRAPARIPKAG